MRRVMSLFLPHWSIERSRIKNARSDKPFVFTTGLAGRIIVTAANAAAAGEGIAPGMALTDARILRPDLDTAEADFMGDRAALAKLSHWCSRFSPWTAPYGGDGVFLDMTGGAHLFGGEAGLTKQLVARLARQGITCRAALADTLGAAWAVSRFGSEAGVVIAHDETRHVLAGLPVASLRLDPSVAALLVQLGLDRIGTLYGVPRSALVTRCGESVALRLDQALGLASEPLSPLPPEKRAWAHRSFAEPLVRPEDIATVTRALLESLCRHLGVEEKGARKLTLALYRVDGRIEEAAIGTALASRDPRHLWRLFEERLPYLDPGLGVEDMVLTANEVEPLVPIQPGFAGGIAGDGVGEEAADLAALIDRLSLRLGVGALVRPRLRESHLPERAVGFLPAFNHAAAKATARLPGKQRPIRLLTRPEPIEAMAPVPDDPPLLFRWRGFTHRMRRAEGPERIEDEWWREIAAPRDYYRVEDEDGRRFWLYRSGLYQPQTRPLWFLHGFFG
jgi:protein ImuB